MFGRRCQPILPGPRHLFRILGFFLVGAVAGAQDASTGALRGTVTDAQGALIPGADVVAIRLDTGLRYHSATYSDGRYALALLPPGEYIARAEAEGMSPQQSPQVHVDVGGTTVLTFKLTVAGPKETLTVSGAPPLVETNPNSVSALVDERAIGDLPLNGRRFTDLALLTPGVTQDPRGLDSDANGDLAFGGIRGFQSSYLVDGADHNNGFFAQARGRYRAPYQFSNEVVQEFRISSNSYGAELGRAGGAVINVVTKSGTNHWHGSGFYFLRDSRLGATPVGLDFNPAAQRHQFGGTLGGPIQRNKVFFYAGYDQHILHVPTVVEFRNGLTYITPRAGTGPYDPGDYDDSDKNLVLTAAANLSKMGGAFPSSMLGNTGFLKLDDALTSHEFLSVRLHTSRYYGNNNVYLDPASPVTNHATSNNGEEDVTTGGVSVALLSALTPKLVNHLRAQFSSDLQQSSPNSTVVAASIYGQIDGFGRASMLPRETREHRLHVAETLGLSAGRHDWKLGGDAMITREDNYYPSHFGGQYYYDSIKVNPFTFEPMEGGLALTPLRAWAHDVPRYYSQNFGEPVSHPDGDDYAVFLQDTIHLTRHLALNLGARYDLQTFGSEGLISNPLWTPSGRMPWNNHNFAPRVGLAYSAGQDRPFVARAGFGVFYTRIPQMYQSTVITGNGLARNYLGLSNTDQSQHLVFPQYPNALVNCGLAPAACTPPDALRQYSSSEISAFAPGFKTPRVEQASLSLDKEVARQFAIGVSYLYVRGVDLIRARDVNLPPPVPYSYPAYDTTGKNLVGFYSVESFATWQTVPGPDCSYPPCINPLVRPIPQLGAIDQFESAASSIYHAMTVTMQRRMTHGVYFRLAYSWAHAIDNGQDALVAGSPALVQNSYAPNDERGPSVTDQRHRLAASWIVEPKPFIHGPQLASAIFNNWKLAGVTTFGSGRPVEARVDGDPNQDDNTSNDRLPGYGRNAFQGPVYSSTDFRLTRRIPLSEGCRLEFGAEAFNIFNRNNERYSLTDGGFITTAGRFVPFRRRAADTYYPGYYQQSTEFLRPTKAFAPRQLQLALRFLF